MSYTRHYHSPPYLWGRCARRSGDGAAPCAAAPGGCSRGEGTERPFPQRSAAEPRALWSRTRRWRHVTPRPAASASFCSLIPPPAPQPRHGEGSPGVLRHRTPPQLHKEGPVPPPGHMGAAVPARGEVQGVAALLSASLPAPHPRLAVPHARPPPEEVASRGASAWSRGSAEGADEP